MNEDPTRRMEPARPPEDRDSGGMSNRAKGLLALLVAAVVGLGVALAVIASGDGDDAPAVEATTTEEAGGEEPATELTDPASGGEATTPGDEGGGGGGGGGGQATQTETEPTGGVSPP